MSSSDRYGRGVLIFGAAGSGTSTLGMAIAGALDWQHVDLDTCFWEPTEPPFLRARSSQDRLHVLDLELEGHRHWVLSGSPGAWNQPALDCLGAAVYVSAPRDVRLQRLRDRELERFGSLIEPGGSMYQRHLRFMDWAAQYDEGRLPGRSRAFHEFWAASAPCPVFRIQSTKPPSCLLGELLPVLRDAMS